MLKIQLLDNATTTGDMFRLPSFTDRLVVPNKLKADLMFTNHDAFTAIRKLHNHSLWSVQVYSYPPCNLRFVEVEASPDVIKSPLQSSTSLTVIEDADDGTFLETLRSDRVFDIPKDFFEVAPPSMSMPSKKCREDGNFEDGLVRKMRKTGSTCALQPEEADLVSEILGASCDEAVKGANSLMQGEIEDALEEDLSAPNIGAIVDSPSQPNVEKHPLPCFLREALEGSSSCPKDIVTCFKSYIT